jgi:hypothetical protein
MVAFHLLWVIAAWEFKTVETRCPVWYRQLFAVYPLEVILLHFGAWAGNEVWVNDQNQRIHRGGLVGFDITPCPGKAENQIQFGIK